MIAYKLVRKLKNGDLAPLFIDQRSRFKVGEWHTAGCFPTKGFAIRPGFHCCSEPKAPHLSEKGRVWIKVLLEDYTEFRRPDAQGGIWYLGNRMKVLDRLDS